MQNDLTYKTERAKILSTLIQSLETEIELSKEHKLSWAKLSELENQRQKLSEELVQIKLSLNENTSQLLID